MISWFSSSKKAEMASKRKRDSDAEYSPSSAKTFKNSDETSSHSRSGRARKKPARFLDEEDGEESPSEGQEVEVKTEEIPDVKPTPTLLAATPQIIHSNPQLIVATPQIISASPQLINATQLISVAPQLISSAPQLISSAQHLISSAPQLINSTPQLISSTPQLISSVPQLISSTPQLISGSPQLITASPHLISGAPQMIVSPEPLLQSKVEPLETPKSSRVRKKSAKVIEMEEFEKAEKVKSTKRPTKIISPESVTVAVSAAPGIQPQILQAANIQLNLMNALNTSTSSDAQSTLLAQLRKNPQMVRVVDDPKPGSVKTEPMLVSGPFVSPGETVMGDQNFSVKDEPIDTVDPNILLPQSAPGSALLTHLTKIAQQEGNVSPTKPPAKKKTPKPKMKEEPGPSMAGDSQSKSVIKMLLNKPAQFSEPVISTQTLSQINSPVSDKNVKKPIKMKISTEGSSMSHMGPAGDAFIHGAPATVTSPVESNKSPTSGSDKKKAKKTKRKQSVSILDDEDEDEEEYDEDDDDDDDLIDDDIDDNEDDMDWEFETQDGNLIIADEVPKKSTSKKTPSKKKGKKDDGESFAAANKDKKSNGQKVKKRKRLTAYTMWCNSVRYKVLNENPGIDFAQLSRRLGEIWQSVPAKDKMAWKRKAKREARKLLGKGLLIKTGKGGGTTTSQSSVSTAPAPPSSSNTPPPIYHPPIRHHSTKHQVTSNTSGVGPVKQMEEPFTSPSKVLGIEPIDTAAHLKLVGDSLSIIGIRLQEHRGLIAVQGSLSVLLDSLLCAVGPLMCLTSQVPELNGCSPKTHTRVLDNIAYIMPGL
ncbi:HMG box-containing protein 4-like [Saccostrea cucullata]|uniref:HMG box-containing protein 4-like n=1 Tax=Saccostrea cuccullata TaxID=36930 RepID=UPI002ED1A935